MASSNLILACQRALFILTRFPSSLNRILKEPKLNLVLLPILTNALKGLMICAFVVTSILMGCTQDTKVVPVDMLWVSSSVDAADAKDYVHRVASKPKIKITFSTQVEKTSVGASVTLKNFTANRPVDVDINFEDEGRTIVIIPKVQLTSFTDYQVRVSTDLQSAAGLSLEKAAVVRFTTLLDSRDKFPLVSDDKLLDIVQRQTFKFFWEFGHPGSGLARDADMRSDPDDCSIGGSGFGIMALPGAIERGFITRAEGLERMTRIVNFLTSTAASFHGAFPHRINGNTGKVILWQGPNDDGGDLVETSFLMMGLLTARQYFDDASSNETMLRSNITDLYNRVEWTWYTRGGQNALYWLWSPTIGWNYSFQCKGWNETLIVYILAASSPTYSITKAAYDEGFASNGGIKNGSVYYDYSLPFGPALGGFPGYSQYSFLGVDPNGLTDVYGDYFKQVKNVHLINQAYCIASNKKHYYFTDSCWGFYGDVSKAEYEGTVFPYVALGGFPYTPTESMKALKYFYYKLGDKIFLDYGFAGAFNWSSGVNVTQQVLVYDQLSYLVSIENYRSQLPWKLFTGCPEIKTGMKKLGFSAPYL
jgi:hypothetical protein